MFETEHTKIAARLKDDLKEGRFTGRLPGVRVLADTYGANFKTINKAVQTLVREGLLITRQGEGRFVADSPSGVRNDLIAMLVRTDGHVFADLAMAMARHAQVRGLTPIVMDALSFKAEGRDADRLRKEKIGTLITDLSSEGANEFVRRHGREFRQVVAVGGNCADNIGPLSRVRPDSRMGMYLATKHLVEQGRRRIVLMHHVWPADSKGYEQTHHGQAVKGYRQALRQGRRKLPEQFLWITMNESDDEKTLRQLFADPADRPDGMVCFMDYKAVWASHLLNDWGLRIPNDVAVVGHNNTPWCELFRPRLTSVSLREEELARLAVEKALEILPRHEEILVAPELVVRESCGFGVRPL
jgi:DNA-binding LacI/PurR family transcriptional regulator